MTATLHILPSTAAVEALTSKALAEEGVIFGRRAVTLRRLAEDIFTLSGDPRRPISPAGRRLLLEQLILERYAAGEGELAAPSRFPGFVTALESFIDEMKQAQLAPEPLAATFRRIPNHGRLLELAALYGRYQGLLAAKRLLDRSDMELAALAAVTSGAALPEYLAGVAQVRCDGIYDFTPLQTAILATLSQRIPLRVAFPYEFGRPALFAYVSRTVDRFEALDNSALNLELEFQEPAVTAFSPLLQALFTSDGDPPPSSGAAANTALLAAPGLYRECEEIGRRIRRLLEAGTDPAAIAVVCRDHRSFGPMMEDVCRRFRIPVSYRRGAPLATSPLVAACLAPFAVCAARYAREELLGLVKCSYFPALRAPDGKFIHPDEVETVLNAAKYLDEGQGRLESLLERRISNLKRRDRSAEREERVLSAIASLMRELRAFSAGNTLAGFTALLERFIDRHALYRRGIDSSDPRPLKRDASAIALLQKVLGNLEADVRMLSLAERRLTPREFRTLLDQGMEGEFLAGERQSGVAILNFHDSRGLCFDHLFVAGLNEGISPARHDGHPLFKDREKLLVNRVLGERTFRTAADKGEEEPLLFYLALCAVRQSLTLSYSFADSRGNEQLRSPFLDEVIALTGLCEERIQVNRITPPIEECLEAEELINALAASGGYRAPLPEQPAAAVLREPLARLAANAEIERGRERFFRATDLARRTLLSTPYTGSLRREDIVTELTAIYESPAGSSFSPTMLEEYGCCPFRHFLKRLLRLAPVEKPELELEPRDEGSLVHEILYDFYSRMGKEGRLPLRGAAGEAEAMAESSARIFARWEAEQYTGDGLLWELGKVRIAKLLQRVVAVEGGEDDGMVPAAFEHPFEGVEVANPDGSTIRLAGKVDRVDLEPASGTLRVVDYKLAGNSQKYRNLLKKENLGVTSFQVPVYLLAAARDLGDKQGREFLRFSARYWLLRKGETLDKEFGDGGKEDFSGFFATDPAERRRLGEDNFLNRLCDRVNAMKGGDFQITPRECDFCDFRSVCRYLEVPLKEEEG